MFYSNIISSELKEASNDMLEKKNNLNDYFKKFKSIFDYFKKNTKELTIIINNIYELKDFYFIFCILRILSDEKNIVNDIIKFKNNNNIIFKLPKKEVLNEVFSPFFLKEKNEFERYVCSEINYFNVSDEEQEMLSSKIAEINDKYIFNLEIAFNSIYSEI